METLDTKLFRLISRTSLGNILIAIGFLIILNALRVDITFFLFGGGEYLSSQNGWPVRGALVVLCGYLLRLNFAQKHLFIRLSTACFFVYIFHIGALLLILFVAALFKSTNLIFEFDGGLIIRNLGPICSVLVFNKMITAALDKENKNCKTTYLALKKIFKPLPFFLWSFLCLSIFVFVLNMFEVGFIGVMAFFVFVLLGIMLPFFMMRSLFLQCRVVRRDIVDQMQLQAADSKRSLARVRKKLQGEGAGGGLVESSMRSQRTILGRIMEIERAPQASRAPQARARAKLRS